MARAVLTMLLLTFAFGLTALTTIAANATRQTPAQSAPGACPEPAEGATQDDLDELPEVVRLEGRMDTDTDSDSFLRQSRLCFEAGASVPEMRYGFTYYIFVHTGELTIVVSAIGSTDVPAGQAHVYKNNVHQAVTLNDPVTLTKGDAIFLANVEVSFKGSTTEATEIIATAVRDVGGPSCLSRCWLP